MHLVWAGTFYLLISGILLYGLQKSRPEPLVVYMSSLATFMVVAYV